MTEEAHQIAPDECPAQDTAADRDRWYPKAAAHYLDVAHWLRASPQDAAYQIRSGSCCPLLGAMSAGQIVSIPAGVSAP